MRSYLHDDDSVMSEVVREYTEACDRYGVAFTSSHEGLGVLIEELDELKSAIHSNKLAAIQYEAIQVAAVAIRLARSCRHSRFSKRSGIGAGEEA